MKPFLLLSTRPEPDAAEGEREALVRLAGLGDDDVVQLRLDASPGQQVTLDDSAGVVERIDPENAKRLVNKIQIGSTEGRELSDEELRDLLGH